MEALTNREVEVVKAYAQGKSRQEIAREWCKSPKTIDTHRTNVMRKRGLHNIVQFMVFACRYTTL